MRLHFPNLVQALRVFIPAISFLLVLLIGGLVQADPLKMLLSAIFVYLFFVILGAVFAGILGRINEEISDEWLGRPDDQLELGKIIDFSQKAELPFDDKARS
ncbi:MAG: hypothetical protein ABIH66_04495 [bacterium]